MRSFEVIGRRSMPPPASSGVSCLLAIRKPRLCTRCASQTSGLTQATVFAPDSFGLNPTPPYRRFFELNLRVYTEGGIHDRIFMTEYLRRHNAEVAQNIPKHRLLIYEIAEGWEPLCSFLGVPTPAAPFPFTNTRGEFPFEMRLAMRRERPKETRNWRRPCRRFCLATLL